MSEETKNYKSLKDMPAEVLAGRVVHSLILQKGNVGQWQLVLQKLIEEIRKEYGATP